DMAAKAATGDREAELLSIRTDITEIETSNAQPANGQGFEAVARLEDPERPPIETFPLVDGRVGDLVDQPPRAWLADPAAAEVIAWRLVTLSIDQGGIDQTIDPVRHAGLTAAAVNEARPVVEIDPHLTASKRNIVVERDAADRSCLAPHRILE